MPEDPEAAYMTAWQAHRDAQTPETASGYLTAIRPITDSAIRTFGGPNPPPTLKSTARRIALDAANTYDPTRGKIKTHLMSQLQGIRRTAAQSDRLISTPSGVMIDAGRIARATNELEDHHGRSPSLGELSKHTGLSTRRIGRVQGYRSGLAEGRFADPGDEDSDSFEPTVEGRDLMEHSVDFLYPELSPIDQLIVDGRFGYRGHPRLSVNEIAARAGITPGAVSQRSDRLQSQLDEIHAAHLF
jgi:DNA-directed RNA polymerase specialized sigma subunit